MSAVQWLNPRPLHVQTSSRALPLPWRHRLSTRNDSKQAFEDLIIVVKERFLNIHNTEKQEGTKAEDGLVRVSVTYLLPSFLASREVDPANIILTVNLI